MTDQTRWLQLVQHASQDVQTARGLDADWPAGTLEDADAALLAALVGQPPPGPSADEDYTGLLSGATGLAGQTKWTAGTGINPNGMDIFVPRHTLVRAPHACRWTFQRVPGGPLPIGQMTLVYADGRAERWRHIVANASSGQAAQGEALAEVYDTSMDMLRWPAGYPKPPDGYQHLDIALATSVQRLDPTGGAGGDVNAYAHIWGKLGGIPGITIIAHTPGPQDGARLARHRLAWRVWAGQALEEAS